MRQHETMNNKKQVHTMEGSQNITEKELPDTKARAAGFPFGKTVR